MISGKKQTIPVSIDDFIDWLTLLQVIEVMDEL
jgi:hypothetical protein